MISLFNSIFNKKDLLLALVNKEITVRYKQSILGLLWAFLQPLILMGLFIMIQEFTSIKSEGIPYSIFVYSALLPWSFFSNGVLYSSASLVLNAPVLKKIYFPREIFPLASVLTSFFDFIAASFILIFLLFYYGIHTSLYIIVIPFLVIIQMLLAAGIGLFLSSIAVYKRDIIIGLPFIMQFWMFASPVMYPFSSVPEKWQILYMLNPMAGIIETYRSILIRGNIPDSRLLLSMIIGTLIILIIGIKVFRKLEKRFADVV